MNTEYIINLSSSLLMPIIAVVTVIILILQYKLGKHRWRLDLYDKRIIVYMDVMKHISNIVASAHLSDQDNLNFLRKTTEIDFLFKKEIQQYLSEIYSKGNDLILTIKLIEGQKDDKVFQENDEKKGELMKWFTNQFDVSKNLFRKYLSITKK